jgi:NADH-quinone oxidoreductase subunit E
MDCTMSVLSEELRNKIRDVLKNYPSKQAATLPALHLTQDALRCVPTGAIVEIAQLLELHPAQVQDTMSFYGFFRISCMLRGGEQLLEDVCERLQVHPGETTADGKTTLEFAECLGACEGAPCILVNDECHMNVSTEKVMDLIK